MMTGHTNDERFTQTCFMMNGIWNKASLDTQAR